MEFRRIMSRKYPFLMVDGDVGEFEVSADALKWRIAKIQRFEVGNPAPANMTTVHYDEYEKNVYVYGQDKFKLQLEVFLPKGVNLETALVKHAPFFWSYATRLNLETGKAYENYEKREF